MPLKLTLKPNEKILIGTSVIANGSAKTEFVVLNRVPATSKLRDSIVADLTGRGLTLLHTGIGNRAGFAHAFAQGLGITEAAPRSTGARGLRALLDEVMELTR